MQLTSESSFGDLVTILCGWLNIAWEKILGVFQIDGWDSNNHLCNIHEKLKHSNFDQPKTFSP